MVQIISGIQFGLWDFAFKLASGYDSHRLSTGSQSLTSSTLPGLESPFGFTSKVSLWDGTSGFSNSDRAYAYLGTGLTVNGQGMPMTGTVTGLLVGDGTGKAAILGGSLNAADIFAASRTTDSRADDLALLRSMFTGDDQAQLSNFADWLATGKGNDVVHAAGGDDSIYGNQGRDFLYGEAGSDLLSGGYGNDRISGGLGRDQIHGGLGDDRLLGNQHADLLRGDAGNDTLWGGLGDDTLQGGAGADRLSGGLGRDRLYGGDDAVRDTFVFATLEEAGQADAPDVIFGFTHLTDRIDLTGIDANAQASGNQSFAFAGTAAADNSVWYEKSGASLIVMADVDGDAQADLSLRLSQTASLSGSDFLL